jgi:hypothetical protein
VIDLNRLREAMTGEMQIPERRLVKVRTLGAVLDAPTVWWCRTNDREAETEAWAGSIRCTGCYSDLSDDDDCGWVALVPITGEDR